MSRRIVSGGCPAAPVAPVAPAASVRAEQVRKGRVRGLASIRRVAALTAALLLLAPLASRALAADAPLPLKFGSFFTQPIGPRGLDLSDTLRAANGRTVRLVGYMVAQEQGQPGRFILTPRPVRMSEHADGEADDLPPSAVTVLLDASQQDRTVPHQDGLIELVGRLAVGREEAADGRVSWVRLQLPPSALKAQAESSLSATKTVDATTSPSAAPHKH